VEGYDLDVVDYLIKPVALERFIKACNRAKKLFELKSDKSAISMETTQDHFFCERRLGSGKIKLQRHYLDKGIWRLHQIPFKKCRIYLCGTHWFQGSQEGISAK